MSNIECNSCGYTFPPESIKMYPRIVRKNKITAVAYCFKCAQCKKEYDCFFKDSQINAFIKKGQREQARNRMSWLKEIFTHDNSV